MDLTVLFSHSPINEKIGSYLGFEDAVALQTYLGEIILIYQCTIQSFVLNGITPFTKKVYRLLKKKKAEDVLLNALYHRDLEVSHFLITTAPDYHEIFCGNQPLITVAGQGDLILANLLLERDCDIDEQCREYTPLIMAVKNNQSEMVKFLLEKGADPNKYPFGYNFSPLITAVVHGRRELLDLLIINGDNLNRDCEFAFQMAVQFLQFDLVQYLYQLSQERNIPISLIEALSFVPFDWFDNTDTKAQQSALLSTVYFLVEKGLNLATNQGEHALYEAISFKIPKLVQYFLDHQVQITHNNRMDGTILHDAVRSKSYSIVQMLLESGRVQEIINFTDQKDRTALQLVKTAKMQELLRRYGAS